MRFAEFVSVYSNPRIWETKWRMGESHPPFRLAYVTGLLLIRQRDDAGELLAFEEFEARAAGKISPQKTQSDDPCRLVRQVKKSGG